MTAESPCVRGHNDWVWMCPSHLVPTIHDEVTDSDQHCCGLWQRVCRQCVLSHSGEMSCVRGHKSEDWVADEPHDATRPFGSLCVPEIHLHSYCKRCAEDRALIERTVKVIIDLGPHVVFHPVDQIIEEVLRGGRQ
jgi:hypothetical protein